MADQRQILRNAFNGNDLPHAVEAAHLAPVFVLHLAEYVIDQNLFFRRCRLFPGVLLHAKAPLLQEPQGAKGESMGYQQCAADPEGGSLVSIVGAVLWEES